MSYCAWLPALREAKLVGKQYFIKAELQLAGTARYHEQTQEYLLKPGCGATDTPAVSLYKRQNGRERKCNTDTEFNTFYPIEALATFALWFESKMSTENSQ